MTGRAGNDALVVIASRQIRHCESLGQIRHCEARSAVAISAVVRPPMDCFVPRNDGGSNDRPGAKCRAGGSDDALVVITSRQIRHCEALGQIRHCEARSAVAISAVVRRPMDCFVPRNEGGGERNDALVVIASRQIRYCEALGQIRHCEARSAVAISAVVRRPMDCFVPRNDVAGAQ
jgi:hypothetical protein